MPEYKYTQLTQRDELPCLEIKHPKFTAAISLQGGQLLEFFSKQWGDLIWLSPSAAYKQGVSIRGGVPICWPWFGAAAKNPDIVQTGIRTPDLAHGFVRNALFELNNIEESSAQVEVYLSLNSQCHFLEYWPYEFKLNYRLVLSEHIELELQTVNLDNAPFSFTQALHSYFPADIRNCEIHGTDNTVYIDALDNWTSKQGELVTKIEQEVDRIYRHGGPYSITTNSNNGIRISSNALDAVIWNPWIEKSKRLSQFANEDYKTMLCIESANVLDNAITLKPKEGHTLTVKIEGFLNQ